MAAARQSACTAITVTPVTQQFGNVVINTSQTRDFTVTNTGQAGSLLSGLVTISGLDLARFSCVLGCTYTDLAVGAAGHIVTIRYSPNAVAANQQAFADFSGGGGTLRPVTGNGVFPIVTNGPLNFGNVVINKTKDLTLTVTNISSTDTFSDTVLVPAPYSCIANCTFTLLPGEFIDVTIRFAPIAEGCYPATGFLQTYSSVTFELSGCGVRSTLQFRDR